MAKSDAVVASIRPCPCGSGKRYLECCELYISGKRHAPTAEALMRSRYTAYTLLDQAYLLKTWHPRSRMPILDLKDQALCKWLGLEVRAYHRQDSRATVEFVARYKINGRAMQLHEVSKFEFEGGQWFYVDGDIRD